MWKRVDVEAGGGGGGWMWKRVDVEAGGCGGGWLWKRVEVEAGGCGGGWMWRRVRWVLARGAWRAAPSRRLAAAALTWHAPHPMIAAVRRPLIDSQQVRAARRLRMRARCDSRVHLGVLVRRDARAERARRLLALRLAQWLAQSVDGARLGHDVPARTAPVQWYAVQWARSAT
eukprot:3977960-Prymnesium_polylepis.1